LKFLARNGRVLAMLMIRLQRTGRTNDASFRIVVVEKARAAKTGKVVEFVGSLHPKTKALTLKKDRIEYWMSVGAQPSDTMKNLLIEQKVLTGKKVNVLPKKTVAAKEEVATPAAASVEAAAPKEVLETETETPAAEEKAEEVVA
jgi:small subunit ribosomal protein S16